MPQKETADKKIQIVVASHKANWMPSDPLYLPLQVGAFGKEHLADFGHDDTGENISSKNPRYSELTALYWAWKNVNADYIGLVHYRRYFRGTGECSTLTYKEASDALANMPVILPKRRHYVIETIDSHYSHTFDHEHLVTTRRVLEEIHPAYVNAFDAHLRERSSHMFNMFVMRRDLLDTYCEWLFPILAEIEDRTDFTNLTAFEARLIGRLSELLLDPWITAEEVQFSEIAVKNLENEPWLRKGTSFLKAKFLGHPYERSF